MKRKPEHILDELLVLQCQAGDEAALAALVKRWHTPFARYAQKLAGSREEAKDVAQDAWVAIIRGLGRLRDPSRFPAWAYHIIKNKAADRIRRRQRQRVIREDISRSGLDQDPASPDEAGKEQIARLRRALECFPDDRRELLRLYYQEDLSVAGIARLMNLPEGTVKSRLYHARAALKKRINAYSHEKVK